MGVPRVRFVDHSDPAYLAYLASPRWRAKRAAAFASQGRRCRGCGATGMLDVHHLSYKRFGGRERPTDLVVVCRACHERIHALVRREGLTLLRASDRVVPGAAAQYLSRSKAARRAARDKT